MFIQKNFSFRGVLSFGGFHFLWQLAWASIVTALFVFTEWKLISIPWVPLSVIATAVAFYIGFKNNQAYDRLWEARKIWGGIVNSSRAWGSMVKAYVRNHKDEPQSTDQQLQEAISRLFYRHIAWLYTLRSQLLIPTPWEHINQGKHVSRVAEKRMNRFGVGLIDDENTEDILKKHLPTEEYQDLINFQNTATQIIDYQSQDLAEIREKGMIEDFRHMELQGELNTFYELQGKCERIKKFPLPRQYGAMSSIFVGIFIFLLPFGLIPEFQKLGEYAIWVSVPVTALVSWVYLIMELVGDYSENPFEGMGNDIPMMSLCRTIEIDLKEMLKETDIPKAIQSKNGVLM